MRLKQQRHTRVKNTPKFIRELKKFRLMQLKLNLQLQKKKLNIQLKKLKAKMAMKNAFTKEVKVVAVAAEVVTAVVVEMEMANGVVKIVP